MMNICLNLFCCFIFLSSCTHNVKSDVNTTLPKTNIQVYEEEQKNDTVSNGYEDFLEKQGLVKVRSLDSTIQVNLKYATEDNFTKQVLYNDLKDAYLHPIAAQKLIKAQQLLKQYDAALSLLVYDAARPLSIQRTMFEVVRSTPYQAYVANPTRTGLHNYGIAVDLTICDSDGYPLDMGTPFDFFGKAAGINKEDELKAQGLLMDKQITNRRLLRKVMTDAGFLTIRGEWWHFNAISLAQAKEKAKLIE